MNLNQIKTSAVLTTIAFGALTLAIDSAWAIIPLAITVGAAAMFGMAAQEKS